MADEIDDIQKKPGLLRKAAGKIAGTALHGTGSLGQYVEGKVGGKPVTNAPERRASPGINRNLAGKMAGAMLTGTGTVGKAIVSRISGTAGSGSFKVPGMGKKRAESEATPDMTEEIQLVATKVAEDINAVRADMETGMAFLYGEIKKVDKQVASLRRSMSRRDSNSSGQSLDKLTRDAKGRFVSPNASDATLEQTFGNKKPPKTAPGIISKLTGGLIEGEGQAAAAGATAGLAGSIVTSMLAGGATAVPIAALIWLKQKKGKEGLEQYLRKHPEDRAEVEKQLKEEYERQAKESVFDAFKTVDPKARRQRQEKKYNWWGKYTSDDTKGSGASGGWEDAPRTGGGASGGWEDAKPTEDINLETKYEIKFETTRDLLMKANMISLDASRINIKGELTINGQPYGAGGQSVTRTAAPTATDVVSKATGGAITPAGSYTSPGKTGRPAAVKADAPDMMTNKEVGGGGRPKFRPAEVETNGERAGLNKKSKLADAQGSHTKDALGIDSRQWNAYREAMAGIESSGGRYDLKGGSSNRFSGAYQFGSAEIADTAKQLGEETPSREAFLADKGMQERYLDRYTKSHHDYLMKNSPQYAKMGSEERLGVLGYAHNQGAGGATEYLKTGQAGSDAFGTSGTKYTKAISDQLARTKDDGGDATKTAAGGKGLIRAVYDQERGYKTRGHLEITDPDTGQVSKHPFVSGGGGKGSAPEKDLKIGEFWNKQDSLGPRFTLNENNNTDSAKDPGIPGVTGPSTRTELRIHQAHGDGTLGCIGVVGDSKVYADVQNRILKVMKANGGVATLRVGSPQAQALMDKMDTTSPEVTQQLTPKEQKQMSATGDAIAAQPAVPPGFKVGEGQLARHIDKDGKLSSMATTFGRDKIIKGLGDNFNKLPADVQDHLKNASQIDLNKIAPHQDLIPPDMKKGFADNGLTFTPGKEAVIASSAVPSVPPPTKTADAPPAAPQPAADKVDDMAAQMGAGALDRQQADSDAQVANNIPRPPDLDNQASGEDVTADVKGAADRSGDKPAVDRIAESGGEGPKSSGGSSQASSLRAPVNHPESEGPSPGSDGYGDQCANPDGGGLCAV